MDERSFHVLLEIKEELGELRSDVRTMSDTLSSHVREDKELEHRVEALEQSNYKLSAAKAVAVAAIGIAWTVATWVYATVRAMDN
jgi:hypothetical protein